MRLIDADKLQDDGVNYSYDKSENFGVISKEYRFVNRAQIDTAPTVEAISIEWLRQKYGWLTMVHEIIADWRNENESDCGN